MFETNSNIIKGMRLAFGGMAPTTVMATKAMRNCIGRYVLCVWYQTLNICMGRYAWCVYFMIKDMTMTLFS
jgi:hypothetical protein